MERIAEGERSRHVVVAKLEASMDRREAVEEQARQRAVEEKEAREAQAEDEKRHKVAASVAAIRAHHMAERERLQQQRAQLHEEAEKERRENEEADRAFASKERERAAGQRQNRHADDTDYIDTMALHRTQRAAAAEDAVAEREALLRATAIEEAMFQEFAARELDKARARGCANVIPIARAAASTDVKPSQPQMGETIMKRGPGNPFPGQTKMRMGFTLKH